jgi:hypothetical protein
VRVLIRVSYIGLLHRQSVLVGVMTPIHCRGSSVLYVDGIYCRKVDFMNELTAFTAMRFCMVNVV